MKPLTELAGRNQLIANHKTNHASRMLDGSVTDFSPVVKLFVCVGGSATWLLTELDPDTNEAFGLCDLGHGYPEIGYVDITGLVESLGWRLERDRWFTPKKTLSGYAQDARNAQKITA
jgi:hypothetical protein